MNTNIEDKLAIEERIARYNHAIDSGDMVTWMDCWADDAIFDGIGKYLVGKPAIQVFADNYQRDYGSNMPAGRHFTVNIVSKINADQASSHSYLQLWSTGAKAK